MEEECFFETSVELYQVTPRHIPEDGIHSYRREKLRSHDNIFIQSTYVEWIPVRKSFSKPLLLP
jgi:hypothetical protein